MFAYIVQPFNNIVVQLHFAASFDKLDTVEELLNWKASVDDGIEDQTDTPLHMAALAGNVEVMKELVRRDANINAWSAFEELGPVMNAAILSGSRDAVRVMVDKGAKLTLDREEEGFRGPLALAALHSDIDMFEDLIGSYAEQLPPKEYNDALIAAAEAGREDIFNKLLEYDHPQKYFQKAIETAADIENHNWNIVSILMDKCQNLNWDQVFYQAARQGEQSMVEMLLDRFRIDPNRYHET